jgi:pyruvate dehydrogenase E2 component (dihydrolipoamide acetyltransferase)
MAQVITMPRLSPTMEEGVLAKWTKKAGDKISPGDVIAEVETDKANMEFPLEDEGVLLKLLVKEGDTVKLGDPVAILGEAGENPDDALKAAPAPKETKPAEEPMEKPAEIKKEESPAPEPVPSEGGDGRVKASPLARKIATEKGVDLRLLQGSGPGGRIVKRDVEGVPATEEARPVVRQIVAPAEDQLVPASQMRKTIARRLVEAKREIPHIYLTTECTVDRLMEMREQLNELGDVKVSVNDLVVKALAMALTRVPEANVSWTADGIVRHGGVHVGMAVSLPDNGLITPVVRDADRKSIGALARETRSLAERARAKKLKPEEFAGGSATVSNLGMYGVREFVAIINPPESVILAVGTTEKRAVVVEKDGRDTIEIARRMTLTLSCDHRVVDGVLGAQLLAEVKKLLEKPMGMLL